MVEWHVLYVCMSVSEKTQLDCLEICWHAWTQLRGVLGNEEVPLHVLQLSICRLATISVHGLFLCQIITIIRVEICVMLQMEYVSENWGNGWVFSRRHQTGNPTLLRIHGGEFMKGSQASGQAPPWATPGQERHDRTITAPNMTKSPFWKMAYSIDCSMQSDRSRLWLLIPGGARLKQLVEWKGH